MPRGRFRRRGTAADGRSAIAGLVAAGLLTVLCVTTVGCQPAPQGLASRQVLGMTDRARKPHSSEVSTLNSSPKIVRTTRFVPPAPGRVGKPVRVGPFEIELTYIARQGDRISYRATLVNVSPKWEVFDASFPQPWVVDSHGRLISSGRAGLQYGGVAIVGRGMPRYGFNGILSGGELWWNQSIKVPEPGATLYYDPVRGYRAAHDSTSQVSWKLN